MRLSSWHYFCYYFIGFIETTTTMKKALLSLVMMVAVVLSAIATDFVTVTGTSVRLRLKPSLQSETLTTNKGVNIHPKKGEKLECLGKSGDFYKVRYQGKVVYISEQFAKPDQPEKPTVTKPLAKGHQQYVVVTGEGVRLRLQPSLQAKCLQRNGVNVHPKKGERIKLMGSKGDFYQVNFQGNYVFIHKDFAKPE